MPIKHCLFEEQDNQDKNDSSVDSSDALFDRKVRALVRHKDQENGNRYWVGGLQLT